MQKPSLRLRIDYPVKTMMFLEYEKIKLKGKLFDEGPIQIEISIEMVKKWHHKLSKMLEHFDLEEHR